jgi:outer membrane receptor protein involved in Fe transport
MSIRNSRSARLAAAVSSALALPLCAGVGTLAGLAVVAPAYAQVTTTQITGVVQTPEGSVLPGASVTITHLPTGATRALTANEEGRFLAGGLRPGGPYTVTVEAEGYQKTVLEDIVTQLGVPAQVDVVMRGGAVMADVVVTGTRDQLLGVASKFDRDQIANSPTITRDIKDVLRNDPALYIDPANVGAMSISGQNNRFNSITVDGVKQNDDFGLNNNGYATNRSPVSLDAVEQISVATSPWDVQFNGFQGGSINVVTKSGTNEFSGSAYYYYNDDSMAGDRSQRIRVNPIFEEKTYGATFGGPILRDRLFFFANYEKFERIDPVELSPNGTGIGQDFPGVSAAQYATFRQTAQSLYSFDPGEFVPSVPEEAEKLLVNVDWNINDAHRARFSWQRTEDFNTVGITTSVGATRSLDAPSRWYERGFKLDQYVAQLFSNWSDVFSTEFRAAKKKVDNRQEPRGGTNFASVEVRGFLDAQNRDGRVFFGPDGPRHANKLNNEQDQLRFRAEYLLGNHTLSAGVEWEKLDVFNLFGNNSRGTYLFNTLTAFQNRQAASFSYQNAITGNANDLAAQFSFDTTSVYLQDRWQVTDDLLLTYGVRYEQYSSGDVPRANQAFFNRYGFFNTETYDGRDLVLPRIGFEWRLTDRTSVSGGVGLFGGGTPNVWLSNSYSTDGVIQANVTITPTSTTIPQAVRDAALNNVTGQIPAAVQAYLATLPGTGTVNAVDPNFEIPSSWRYNLGIEHEANLGFLGDGWNLSADVEYTEVKDAVLWQDLRLVRTGSLRDGRARYEFRPTDPSTGAGRGLGTQDLLLTNTQEGSSLVLKASIDKAWDTRAGIFDMSFGYAFTDAEDVNPATASIAASNWNNIAVSDVNNPTLSTSNYEVRHRFPLRLSWRKAFFGDNETAVNLFVERRAGLPYSYVFNQSAAAFTVFGDRQSTTSAQGGGNNGRQLFYVPVDASDVVLTGGLTWAALDAFIVAEGLDRYRGQIAPRNGFRSPWVTTADLQLRQELPGFGEGHKAVLSFDILNVANLINKDWGRFEQVGFPYVVRVAEVQGIDPATGRYIMSGINGGASVGTKNLSTNPISTSLWRVQVGIRYQF